MKNTSNQKPIRKVKPSKKPNTASILSTRENQAVDSTPKQKRRSKFERRSSRFNTTLTIIVAIVVLCILGFLAIKSSMTTQADMQHFVELKKTTDSLNGRLNSVTPDNVSWSNENSCAYLFTKTTGSWTCSVLISSEVSPAVDNINKLTYSFFDAITSSNELRQIGTTSSKYDYPNTISEGGYIARTYETKAGNIRCNAKSSFPSSDSDTYVNGNIIISLLCSGGAQKSWYPNSEAIRDESLRPGVNAWKSIK